MTEDGAPTRALPAWVHRFRSRWVAQAAILAALGLALAVLHRRLAGYPWHELSDGLAALGAGPIALAVLATGVSYSTMIAYDAMALAYVEHEMPARRYAAASFVATAFGNTLGASALVGAALRARLYSAWGLPAFAITRVAGFNLITLGLGSSVLVATGLAWGPPQIAAWLPLARLPALLVALLLAAAVVGYLLWCGRGKPPVTVRDWRIDRPTRTMAVTQVTVSVLEWLTMAAVLYVLLPKGHGLAFAPFAVLFVLATTLGLISNVPGGVGIVEAVLVLALTGHGGEPAPGLVTALVAYRLIYYLLPLGLAAGVLAVLEARRHPDRAGALARVADVLTPSLFALLLLVLGGILIVSDGPTRLGPFTASVAGVGLLLLARGLHRRLRGAWVLTLIVLASFVVTHRTPLVVAVAGFALLLALARRAFSRTTSILSDPRGWIWPALVTGICLALAWHDAWLDDAHWDRSWLAAVTGTGRYRPGSAWPRPWWPWSRPGPGSRCPIRGRRTRPRTRSRGPGGWCGNGPARATPACSGPATSGCCSRRAATPC